MATLAGAYVGSAIAGTLGATIGGIAGRLIDNALFSNIPPAVGARLSDLSVQSSTYGSSIPIIYGTVRIAGNVIWSTDLREVRNRSERDISGKGSFGSQSQEVFTYSYFVTIAIAICEGEVSRLKSVYADSQILNLLTLDYEFFNGSESQAQSSIISAVEGVDKTPSYRGTCYIVIRDFPLYNYGNRIPNFTFEIERNVSSNLNVSESIDSVVLTNGNNPFAYHMDVISYQNKTSDNIVYGVSNIVNRTTNNGLSDGRNQIDELLDSFNISEVILPIHLNIENDIISAVTISDLESRQYNTTISYPTPVVEMGEGMTPTPVSVDSILTHLEDRGVTNRNIMFDIDRSYTSNDATYLQNYVNYLTAYLVLLSELPTTVIMRIPDGASRSSQSLSLFNPLVSGLVSNVGFLISKDIALQFTTSDFAIYRNKRTRLYFDGDFTASEIESVQSVESSGSPSVRIPITFIHSHDSVTDGYRDDESQRTSISGVYNARLNSNVNISINGWNITFSEDSTSNSINGKINNPILSDVCNDIANLVGIESNQTNFETLTQSVNGYIVASVGNARNYIDQLSTIYQFDIFTSDGLINATRRGGDSIVQIPSSELIELDDNEAYGYESITSPYDSVPSKVYLTYMRNDTSHLSRTYLSQRQIEINDNQIRLEYPIVLNDEDAAHITEVQLISRWYGRESYRIRCSFNYMGLRPGDVITLDNNRLRVTSVTIGNQKVVELNAVPDESIHYIRRDFRNQFVEVIQPTISDSDPETIIHFIDLPATNNAPSDTGVIRFAAQPLNNMWPGVTLFRSAGSDAEFNTYSTIETPCVTGQCSTSTLQKDIILNVMDRGSHLRVYMDNGSLQSVSLQDLYSGSNAFMLGNEVIQFQDAELISLGVYDIKNFLRGRLGTEDAIGTHDNSERLILLDSNIVSSSVNISDINVNYLYAPVTSGTILQNADHQNFTYSGNTLKPYSPVHIEVTISSNNDVLLSWIRRSRIDSQFIDYIDVPLHELSESYTIDIYDGDTLLRNVTTSSTNINYTNAQQATDGFKAGDTLEFRIFQNSSFIGRGFQSTIKTE